MTTTISKHATCTAAITCAVLALWLAAPAQAQTEDTSLSLFEPVDQGTDNDQSQTSGPRNPSVSAGGGPQFSLVGTSRFGDRYTVSVRDSSGEVITVDAGAGGDAAIPGYPGFSVTHVASRHVLLQQPASSPCFEFSDQGVTCEDGNTARLALATAEPVAPPPEPERRRDRRAEDGDAQNADAGEQNTADQPMNPFANALRAARERDGEPDAAASRAEAQRFRPRRIDPEDVPEGYRLVRTPFGDRMVPL
ncbi:hypothetical protein [Pseudohongiella sp.]|uniref:Uncharacterized protein n=1 Tax=marine sediment metagenome TaxID=412755 RepID=A0A0F9YA12_9ZZZZ|nr:hypothetical protein [Pseudohongiella sp.]HDZ08719.1 hypothetical protein [Pseudohongiella sp.]HEA62335.1 hypothetical protein [Pseudohongiella sp.]